MTRLVGFVIAVVVAVVAGVAAGPQEKKPEPPAGKKPAAEPEEKPPTAREMTVQHRPNHKRVNGALLTITAGRKPRDRAGQVLEVEWKIDYTGPRLPFIVVGPSMQDYTGTNLIVYYEGDDGAGRMAYFGPREPGGLWFAAKEWFVQSEGRKPITGKLEVAVAKLEEIAAAKGRNQPFRRGDFVWVRMTHRALDRGNGNGREFALDAWTGVLSSDSTPVEF